MLAKNVLTNSLPEGWILLNGLTSAKWHYRDATGFVLCDRKPPYPPKAYEWRPEPSGRRDVCPNCRRHLMKRQREEAAHAETQKKLIATPIPVAEPEVLALAADPEPVAAPARVPEVAAMSQAEVIQHPSAEKPKTTPTDAAATFISFATFVKSHGWDCRWVDQFMLAVMPETPKFLGGRSRVPQWILDAPTRERIARDYQPWRDERNREAKEARVKPKVEIPREKRAKLPVPKRLELIETDVSEMRKMLEAIIRDLKVQL